jgi:CheY-like chemotaxis protein
MTVFAHSESTGVRVHNQRRAGSAVGRRILLVEDEPDCRRSFQVLLEMCGYQVEVATNGLEGVEKGLAWKPDVVILDIGLPILNGYEVAEVLRKHLGSTTTIVAFSADVQSEDRSRAIAAGFNEEFTKPTDLARLMRMLEDPRA